MFLDPHCRTSTDAVTFAEPPDPVSAQLLTGCVVKVSRGGVTRSVTNTVCYQADPWKRDKQRRTFHAFTTFFFFIVRFHTLMYVFFNMYKGIMSSGADTPPS